MKKLLNLKTKFENKFSPDTKMTSTQLPKVFPRSKQVTKLQISE